jgi:hypothetical protein
MAIEFAAIKYVFALSLLMCLHGKAQTQGIVEKDSKGN